MELVIILFFLAIFAGAIFLAVLIYVLYKVLRRKKNAGSNKNTENIKS